MSNYLNKATKEIAVCMAGCLGFADKLLECNFRGSDKTKDALRDMKEAAGKVLDGILDGVDQDHVRAVLRYAGASQLMVIPQTNPQTQREYYIVPDTAMSVFLKQATGDCFLCEKEGKECRKCEIRKALLDSMVLGIKDQGDCPYKETTDCRFANMVDHLIANGVTIQKWIPVEERLPEDGDFAIVTYIRYDNGMPSSDGIAYRNRGWWYWRTDEPEDDEQVVVEITHWMPLPEPPKENE